ncbi:MAG: flagellar motor protein MotB [Elusimicrobiota bacterium]|nr:flagellar motor protein MotB [Elusimicrobiota bacterium]
MSRSNAGRRRSDMGIKGQKGFDSSSWKTPYGTMMLLCMIFFMILYAISLKSGVEYEGVIAKLQTGVSHEERHVKDVETAEKMTEIFGSEKGVIQMDARKIKIMLDTPVLFASGSAELKDSSRGVLGKVAKVIKETRNKVNVAGHTDNIPFRALPGGNFELSTLRAFNVIKYFIDVEKIPPSRFSAYGFGAHRPVASNSDSAGRSRNRRIEISILREHKTTQNKGAKS